MQSCVCVCASVSCDSGQCPIEGSAILSLLLYCTSLWHSLKKICLPFIAAVTSTRNGKNPVKSIDTFSITIVLSESLLAFQQISMGNVSPMCVYICVYVCVASMGG